MRRLMVVFAILGTLLACEEEETRVENILALDGNPDAGADVFMGGPCVECHRASGLGVDDPDNPGIGANLRESVLSDAEMVVTILHGRNQMPAFEETLSDQQIANVLSFIRENFTE